MVDKLDETSPPAETKLPEGHRSGFVVVVGLPNSGKSTLLNAFLKQKVAIVTPKPQTTRLRQLGILTTETFQMIFVDTPGLMKEARHKLDEFMLEAARESFSDADVVLWVADAGTPPNPGDRAIAAQLAALRPGTTAILALNKNDLLKPDEILPRTDAYRILLPEAPWLLISALKGMGCEELLAMIAEHLPEGPRYYPAEQITDSYVRDIAAEMIREQAMLQLRDEVPYGVAVLVDEFKERENEVTYIAATIFVDRGAHKRIVIGTKGAQLRRIGAAARKEIETLLDTKVYLDLWVKVEPNWRQDERVLRRLGYTKRE